MTAPVDVRKDAPERAQVRSAGCSDREPAHSGRRTIRDASQRVAVEGGVLRQTETTSPTALACHACFHRNPRLCC